MLLVMRETVYRTLHENTATIKPRSHIDWPKTRAFLRQLNDRFNLFIANFNYDTVVEEALAWGGLTSKDSNPRQTNNCGDSLVTCRAHTYSPPPWKHPLRAPLRKPQPKQV